MTGVQPILGYTTQVPGGVPGQNGIYVAMPKQDGDFMKALKALWPTFVRIHKSEGDKVVLENLQLKSWWWVIFLLFSLVSGLTFSVWVARSSDIIASGFINADTSPFGAGNVSPYSILTFGYWFLVFFVTILVSFVAVILRAVFVKTTAAVVKGQMSFLQACNVVATGLVLPTFALAAIFVIELLPIPIVTLLLASLLWIVVLGSLFMGELLISTAIRNITKTEKSIALWHAMFLVVFMVCLSIVYGIIAGPTTAMSVARSSDAIGSSVFDQGYNNLGRPNLEGLLGGILGQ